VTILLLGCANKALCGKSEFCAVAPYITITEKEKDTLSDETFWQIYNYDQIYYNLCIKDK
jgi:hypothetical protein